MHSNYILLRELQCHRPKISFSTGLTAQLNTLVDMQKDPRTVHCLVVFPRLLHQLFEFLEVGGSAKLAVRDGQESSIPRVLTGELKSFGDFGLGASAVDVEE